MWSSPGATTRGGGGGRGRRRGRRCDLIKEFESDKEEKRREAFLKYVRNLGGPIYLTCVFWLDNAEWK